MAEPEEVVSEYVERSLLCGTCGYELRGLVMGGVCPECGTSVSASMHAYSLRWASEEYLAALVRGVRAIEIAAALRVASVVGMWFFGGFFFGGKEKKLLGELVSMGIAVVFAVGWWWMTTADLRRTTPEGRLSPRRMARGSACVVCLAWCLLDGLKVVHLQGVGIRPLWLNMGKVLWLLAIVVQYFAAIDYFAIVAKKAEDPRAHKWISTCRWLVPIGVVAAFIPAVALYFTVLESVRGFLSREQARRLHGEIAAGAARARKDGYTESRDQ